MNIFRAVTSFHRKFKMHWHKKPGFLNQHLFNHRVSFMGEELNEFVDAYTDDDLAGALDAMIDLIYVASGTLHLMGFTHEQQAEAFRRVHKANLEKIRVRSAHESKRKSLWDVRKPAGWKAPDLTDLCR